MGGEQRRPRDKVRLGDRLAVTAELVQEVGWQAQAIDLDIIYERPQHPGAEQAGGLVVHPAAGHADGTWLTPCWPMRRSSRSCPGRYCAPPDMETSGIMVVARSLTATTTWWRTTGAHRQAGVLRVCIGAMTGGGTVDAPMGAPSQAAQENGGAGQMAVKRPSRTTV